MASPGPSRAATEEAEYDREASRLRIEAYRLKLAGAGRAEVEAELMRRNVPDAVGIAAQVFRS